MLYVWVYEYNLQLAIFYISIKLIPRKKRNTIDLQYYYQTECNEPTVINVLAIPGACSRS